MSTQKFSFPPPPPPPSLHTTNTSILQPARTSSDWRGRGRGRGSFSGRGQNGNWHSRAGLSTHQFQGPKHGGTPYGNRDHQHQGQDSQRGRRDNGSGANRGQKRRHDQAFSSNRHALDKHTAPPSVPSFGFDMSAILQPSSVPSKAAANKQPPTQKRNMFGLAPSMDDTDEGGDDDEEEEMKLAKSYQSGSASLQVTYGGQTMSLNSPEDLAAWIAERKKKFPTRARVEEASARAKAEAEERARQRAALSEERKKSIKDKRQKGTSKDDSKNAKASKKTPHSTNAGNSQLERELKEARRRIKELERGQVSAVADNTQLAEKAATPLRKKDLGSSVPETERAISDPKGADESDGIDDLDKLMETSSDDDGLDSLIMANSSDIESVEDTSSSGTSSEEESDEDDKPTEISSKSAQPKREMPAARERPVCRDFGRTGRCPRGSRCHFKHQTLTKKERAARQEKQGHGSVQGKSLFQRLREQELEMRNELVLQHILYLGDHGYLEDSPSH